MLRKRALIKLHNALMGLNRRLRYLAQLLANTCRRVLRPYVTHISFANNIEAFVESEEARWFEDLTHAFTLEVFQVHDHVGANHDSRSPS